jgi:hypothetical protein
VRQVQLSPIQDEVPPIMTEYTSRFANDLIQFEDGPAVSVAQGRRAFIQAFGLAGLGAAILGGGSTAALAQAAPSDLDIANFALNLEYLGAEFYLRASVGQGLADAEVTGSGTLGPVAGGRQVNFATRFIANFANQLARDERAHVRSLRLTITNVLGGTPIARPAIDLAFAFTLAARSAGIVGPNDTFDPYANENNFLQAAFIFEDVCVTALAGAAPLIRNKTFLASASGFLATESYQAGAIRTFLYSRNLLQQAGMISGARDALDGPQADDQGIGDNATINITPTDVDGLAFARTPQQVLRIAYLNANGTPNGFFPNGVNGTIR